MNQIETLNIDEIEQIDGGFFWIGFCVVLAADIAGLAYVGRGVSRMLRGESFS
jgi:hypothetical protein